MSYSYMSTPQDSYSYSYSYYGEMSDPRSKLSFQQEVSDKYDEAKQILEINKELPVRPFETFNFESYSYDAAQRRRLADGEDAGTDADIGEEAGTDAKGEEQEAGLFAESTRGHLAVEVGAIRRVSAHALDPARRDLAEQPAAEEERPMEMCEGSACPVEKRRRQLEGRRQLGGLSSLTWSWEKQTVVLRIEGPTNCELNRPFDPCFGQAWPSLRSLS